MRPLSRALGGIGTPLALALALSLNSRLESRSREEDLSNSRLPLPGTRLAPADVLGGVALSSCLFSCQVLDFSGDSTQREERQGGTEAELWERAPEKDPAPCSSIILVSVLLGNVFISLKHFPSNLD